MLFFFFLKEQVEGVQGIRGTRVNLSLIMLFNKTTRNLGIHPKEHETRPNR